MLRERILKMGWLVLAGMMWVSSAISDEAKAATGQVTFPTVGDDLLNVDEVAVRQPNTNTRQKEE